MGREGGKNDEQSTYVKNGGAYTEANERMKQISEIEERSMNAAEGANIREQRKRAGEAQQQNGRRKGGVGRGKGARPVYASNIEEELMKDIGVPQHTWGDGSYWLGAVAGTRGQLEGKEGPTENDIQVERAWRAAIQVAVKEHGITMLEEEYKGLSEGVQYSEGRLVKGGTWGGGTEHQALAMILKINIIGNNKEGEKSKGPRKKEERKYKEQELGSEIWAKEDKRKRPKAKGTDTQLRKVHGEDTEDRVARTGPTQTRDRQGEQMLEYT
eukprot:1439726-Pleurochrysis_carterae.AAC.1